MLPLGFDGNSEFVLNNCPAFSVLFGYNQIMFLSFVTFFFRLKLLSLFLFSHACKQIGGNRAV